MEKNCMTEQPLLTRRQLVIYLNEQGFPIGSGTLNRLCSPAYSDGPPVAGWWGNRPMYEPAAAIEWARARLRPKGGPISDKRPKVTEPAGTQADGA
jgi:hypothetical protein